MSHSQPIDIDSKSPPFDQFKSLHRLSTDRSGHHSVEHVRHQLYVGRDRRTQADVLIKLTTKPGLVYEQNLTNEMASLTTINRELPHSRYFPVLKEHGRLPDGRLFLITSLFDELPLAMAIGPERLPAKTVAYLRATMEIADALAELHRLRLYHVDLNPMNILYREERGRPVIRIVDFESSYEEARHSPGVFYSPPTTPSYSAPEVSHRPPDAAADLYSLGATLYTMLAGYEWTWSAEVGACVRKDRQLDPALRQILLSAVDAQPERRLASAGEFRAAIDAYLETIWPGRSR